MSVLFSRHQCSGEVATMFALIILSVVGYVLYVAVALLRRLVVPWHHSVAGWTQRPVA